MPKTSRQLTVHPITVREVHVIRVADVSPGMRRITLGGDQLKAFTSANGIAQPPFVSSGFDDDIRLFFPYPGESEPVLPTQKDGSVAPPKGRRPLNKVYSVRRWDSEAGELDVDFVRHGVGVATTWAYRAKPGDRLHFLGPGTSRALPVTADWLLVAGDDTAIPAIGRLLEELPSDAQAQVFIEVAEDAHRQDLRQPDGVDIVWLARNGAEPGTSTALLDALKNAQWREGKPFAWIAGEQATVRDIRRHLVEERGVPKEDIEFTGYWRRQGVVALEADAAVPDQEKTTLAFDRFHDLSELYPPIAIRVAVELGIGDLISRGVSGVSDLAQRTETDERALRKLLRYLAALEVLEQTEPGNYKLTEVGEFLTAEMWIDTLHPDGMFGRQHMGIFGLAESVRTGKAAYASVSGSSFADLRTEQWYEDKYLDRVATVFGFIAGPLVQVPELQDATHVVVHSGGAGVIAREAVATHPNLAVTLCALPAQADWLRRDIPVSIPNESQRARVRIVERSMLEPSEEADVVIFASPKAPLPDDDAVEAFRLAAEGLNSDGRILLLEATLDENDLDEHGCEDDLLALTRDGTGLRTEGELATVIDLAGLSIVESTTVGRGGVLRVLARK